MSRPPMLLPPPEFFAEIQRIAELPAQLDAALARIAKLEERLATLEGTTQPNNKEP